MTTANAADAVGNYGARACPTTMRTKFARKGLERERVALNCLPADGDQNCCCERAGRMRKMAAKIPSWASASDTGMTAACMVICSGRT